MLCLGLSVTAFSGLRGNLERAGEAVCPLLRGGAIRVAGCPTLPAFGVGSERREESSGGVVNFPRRQNNNSQPLLQNFN